MRYEITDEEWTAIKTTLYVQTVPKGGPRHSMGGAYLGT
jgi:hypothetical protein